MNGERFYTFTKGNARFFVLDSNYMDQAQLKWLEDGLSKANDRWKIAYFHHPLYSSGEKHGSEVDLRTQVEPLFIKYGVDVVFAGHEHFYERIKPQNGIYYFIEGGSAKLRKGDIRKRAADGRRIRHRLHLHTRRARERRHAVPGAVAQRQANRLRFPASCRGTEEGRREQAALSLTEADMNRSSTSAVVVCFVTVACFSTGCARPTLGGSQVKQPAPQVALVELWSEPTDIAQRDLFWGGSRRAEAPSTDDVYTVLSLDKTGYSRGYDVKGADGREWAVKVGDEVQSEIVLSRILWALGYYQPQTFYVTGWQLAGEWEKEGEPARFRLQSDHESDGEWAWLENPFAGTRPLQGLVAISLVLNNWDLKTSNNRVYRLRDDNAEPAKRYVVQDLGASLGKPRGLPYYRGTRNDIDDYEDLTSASGRSTDRRSSSITRGSTRTS